MGVGTEELEEALTALLERLGRLPPGPASAEAIAALRTLGQRVEAARLMARQERQIDELRARSEAQVRDALAQVEAEAARARAEHQAAVDRSRADVERRVLEAAEALAAARLEEVEVLLTFSRTRIERYYQVRMRTLQADRARLEAALQRAGTLGGTEGEYLAAAAARALDGIVAELAALERKAPLIRRATLGA